MDNLCAAYIRVSTEDQTEFSPESQREKLRQYARQHGLILPEAYIFTDAGISGRRAEKRPAFMALIAAAKEKPAPFSTVLVWKFSRFARNQEESIVYKSMLRRQCGVEVVSISEPLPFGEFGALVERIIEWMDEYYSIRLSEEVRRGMQQRLMQGKTVSAAPFGYVYRNKMLEVDAEAAAAVRLLFAYCAEGATPGEAAEKLNRLGVRTARGNLWSSRSVRYVLQNPIYAGWLPPDESGRKCRGVHCPIVSEAVFQSVRVQLPPGKNKSGQSIGFLRGLVCCSICGRVLTGTRKALHCSGYAHQKCMGTGSISAEKLENILLSAFAVQLKGVTLLPPEKSNAAVSDIQVLLEKEKQKLEKCRAAYLMGTDTLEEYTAQKGRIEKNIRAIKAEITALAVEKNTETGSGAIALPAILSDPKVPAKLKNALLRTVIDRILFDGKENTLTVIYKV